MCFAQVGCCIWPERSLTVLSLVKAVCAAKFSCRAFYFRLAVFFFLQRYLLLGRLRIFFPREGDVVSFTSNLYGDVSNVLCFLQSLLLLLRCYLPYCVCDGLSTQRTSVGGVILCLFCLYVVYLVSVLYSLEVF